MPVVVGCITQKTYSYSTEFLRHWACFNAYNFYFPVFFLCDLQTSSWLTDWARLIAKVNRNDPCLLFTFILLYFLSVLLPSCSDCHCLLSDFKYMRESRFRFKCSSFSSLSDEILSSLSLICILFSPYSKKVTIHRVKKLLIPRATKNCKASKLTRRPLYVPKFSTLWIFCSFSTLICLLNSYCYFFTDLN